MHSARWRFEAFELDETRRELRHRGELLVIEPQPLNLLMLMVRNPGGLLTKDEIAEALWTGRIAGDAVISMCVSKLRQALGVAETELVKTVFGHGYRFDCEVERITDDIAESAAPKVDLTAGGAVPQRPNWTLVRRLGKSGDAWLAEHAKTRARRVFKFTSEPRGLSGLKREVTIFRLLHQSLGDQPCFVQILDWNFEEPPWFIEAEYCAGGSLQEWFEAQGGIARVPLTTRLELIAQIADALSQIHALGVLHKDLKPANVFIVPGDDGRPTIRLADFGSGHLLDEDRLRQLEITRAGFTTHFADGEHKTSGTLLYLAPEVLKGQPATAKADIYALGVMLYQVVSARVAGQLTGGWEQHIDDELLREDIAATANVEPSGRLADAAELARRLRGLDARRQQREAERAAAAAAERAARAAERVKARRVGLILAFAAMTAGFVVSLAMYLQARQAKQIAEAETRRSEKVAAFLGEDMFKAVARDDRPVRDVTIKDLLDSAAAAADRRFAGEPDIGARLLRTLGTAYAAFEYFDAAQEVTSKALALYEKIDPASNETIDCAAETIVRDWTAGRLSTTIVHYESIERAARQRLGANAPSVDKLTIELGRGYNLLGFWQRGSDLLASVYARRRDAQELDPALTISAELALGHVETYLARYHDAETHLRDVLERIAALKGSRHLDMARAGLALTDALTLAGAYPEAAAELDKARSVVADWTNPDSQYRESIRFAEARLKGEAGDYAAAVAGFEALLRDHAAYDGDGQIYVMREPLALAYRSMGRTDDAEKSLRLALASATRGVGPNHPATLSITVNLADLLCRKGYSAEAEQLLAGISPAAIAILPDAHPIRINLHRVNALQHKARGAPDRARAELKQALASSTQVFGPLHSRTIALVRELEQIPEDSSSLISVNRLGASPAKE